MNWSRLPVLAMLLLPPLLAGCGRGIKVDAAGRRASVPAVVSEQGKYLELKGAIEYVLVTKGGKSYESVFETEEPVEKINAALTAIGLRPGATPNVDEPAHGPPVNLFVEYKDQGKQVRRPLDDFIVRVEAAAPGPATGQAAAPELVPLRPEPWLFTGSSWVKHPETKADILRASLTQSVIGLHWADESSLVANPRPECRRQNLYRSNLAALPPAGTKLRIVFERPPAKVPPGTRRVVATVSGRLASVGYDTYVEHLAKRLGMNGFLRVRDGGGMEIDVEGPAAALDEFIAGAKRGPLAARVANFAERDEPPTGDFNSFEVWR